jgi:predicted Zn-dependent peptidase
MGQSVLGRVDNIQSLSRERIVGYFDERYRSNHMIVSVAGKIEHDEVVDLVGRAFLRVPAGMKMGERVAPRAFSQRSVLGRKTEQVHICLGTKGLAYVSPRRFVSYLLNAILGGGMSSRLFQEIRERRGLAYSVFSYIPSYVDTGSLVVYAATEKNAVTEVIQLILKEFEALSHCPVGEEELRISKEQLKGNVLLSLESSDNRMTRLAKNEIYFNRFLPVDEVINRIEAVTIDEIRELSDELFRPEHLCLTLLGPVTESRLNRDLRKVWPAGLPSRA